MYVYTHKHTYTHHTHSISVLPSSAHQVSPTQPKSKESELVKEKVFVCVSSYKGCVADKAMFMDLRPPDAHASIDEPI
jgi:hypothetical protein